MASCTGEPRKLVMWLMDQDQSKTFEVKEKRKRRSRSQNSYYWELNDKLADALRMERMELHFNMLRSYAPCEVMSVLEKVPLGDYFTYYEVFAHGKLNGKDYKHVRIYKRSSRMDSREFSRLLDGIIQECEQQGIPTLTRAEVAGLDFVEPKDGPEAERAAARRRESCQSTA